MKKTGRASHKVNRFEQKLKIKCSTDFCLIHPDPHLICRLLWLKVPHPNIGGMLTVKVYPQMKMRVTMVERGVDRGNCLSLVTIMYLCMASTDKVTMDWIPNIKYA